MLVVRPAFMPSLKSFIQANIAHVTVERAILVYPADTTFITMEGVFFLAGEMLANPTKIFRQLDFAGWAVARVF